MNKPDLPADQGASLLSYGDDLELHPATPLSERKIDIAQIPRPDFTIYKNKSGIKEVLQADDLQDDKGSKKYSYSGPLRINHSKGKLVESRALACRAYRDQFWSITLRCGEENAQADDPYANWVKANKGKYDEWLKAQVAACLPSELQGAQPESNQREVRIRDFLGYCPKGYSSYSVALPGSFIDLSPASGNQITFLNEIYTLCRLLYTLLFDSTSAAVPASAEAVSPARGLVVITGATDSSKSLITRGLIFLLLEELAKKARQANQRRPHLITYEDPIEEYYVRSPATKTLPCRLDDLQALLEAFYIDYTPREKSEDADGLAAVLKDALRQTPAALFVGETRDKEDWQELLQFAGSGHLVVTTSHAGSVVEAMNGIFRNTDTKTAAQRSEIARRILAIINIRSLTVSPAEPAQSSIRALLPALWKRTPQSINNLIADGLASILPVLDRETELGYYGRTYFIKELTKVDAKTKMLTDEMCRHPQKTDALKRLSRQAKEWDIKGE